MINLKEHLTGGIFVTHDDIKPRAKKQADGIIKSREQRGDKRSEEQIRKLTYPSIACEIGLARALPNGKLNEKEFDKTDVTSFGWDISAITDIKFEVKHLDISAVWYSYYESTYERLQRYSSAYDYILVASTVGKENGLVVWPRFLIEPRTMRSFHNKSQYNMDYWYNHHSAYGEDCDIFNTAIVKKMQKSEKNGVHLQKSVVE